MKSAAVVAAALAVIVGAAGIAHTQQTSPGRGYLLIDIAAWKPGRYPVLITVDANKRASVVPLPVTRLNGTTPDPGGPITPPAAGLAQTVSQLTKQVTDPEKEDNAAGLAVIYSVVSSQIGGGNLQPKAALGRLKTLTDAFLAERKAADNWTAWRQGVGAALAAEYKAGRLTTSAQYTAALETVAKSLASDAQQSAAKGGRRLRFTKILRVVMQVLETLGDGGDFDLPALVKILLGLF
tara:strand:+ start:258 stop:971 length:714 start_codon:yes stop_codon:yes gene_type:complete